MGSIVARKKQGLKNYFAQSYYLFCAMRTCLHMPIHIRLYVMNPVPSTPENRHARPRRQARPRRPLRVALSLSLTTSYSRQKVNGILTWYRKHGGWSIAMHDAQPYLSPAQLQKWKGDGILGEFFNKAESDAVMALGIPTVNTSGMLPFVNLPTVSLDDREIGRLAGRHLMSKGFRELHFVGLEMNRVIAQARLEGMEEEAAGAGIPVVAHWTTRHIRDAEIVHPRTYLHLLRRLKGREAGIFCMTDRVAYGVLQACGQLGFDIPAQIAVVGSNNDEILCQLASPPLSSVDESATSVGYHAAEMLQTLMTGGSLQARHLRVPPAGLRVRTSSDRLPQGPDDLTRALSFIREHAGEPIGVPDVLRHVMVSRRTLETLFRKITGNSIYHEIRRIHIERACELLRDTSAPILEVARQCGFQSLQRFEANFREFAGCSATTYRNRHLSNSA